MKKKKTIKLNKDETLESIEQELNNAMQFLDNVNQKVSEILKESQKGEEHNANNENAPIPESLPTEQTKNVSPTN